MKPFRRSLTAATDAEYESDNSDEVFEMKVHDYTYADSLTGKSAYLEFCEAQRPPLVPVSGFLDNIERTQVTLNHSGLRPLAARAMAECLKKNQCITSLNLAKNAIGDLGAAGLADAFASNSVLTAINLSANNIGAEGGRALGDAIASSETLVELDVSNNKLGNEFAVSAGRWLKSSPAEIIAVSLERIGMTAVGVEYVASGLARNRSIAELNLSWNELCAPGGLFVAEALAVSPAPLVSLNLSFCGLDDVVGVAIARALYTNTSLVDLNLNNNNFTFKTAIALAQCLGGEAGLYAAAGATTEAGPVAAIALEAAGGTLPEGVEGVGPAAPAAAGAGAGAAAGAGGKAKPPAKAAAKPAKSPKKKGKKGKGATYPAKRPGPPPRHAVRATLPELELCPVNSQLIALRLAHNPLSLTGSEILVRSLETNSTLSVLDLTLSLTGDGPRLWRLEEEVEHDAMLAKAAELKAAAAAKKGKGKKKKGAAKSKGKKGAEEPPAEDAPVKIPGGGTPCDPIVFKSEPGPVEFVQMARVVLEKRDKMMKVFLGYPDAKEVC